MKIKIFKNISITELKRRVQSQYHNHLPAYADGTMYTVIWFVGTVSDSGVIMSSKVLKALKRLPPVHEPVIILATEFTIDAIEVMKQKQITPIYLKDYWRTDEIYKRQQNEGFLMSCVS